MAQKQYTMQWLLTAAAAGNFSQTFQTASKQLKETTEKLKELNKAQSDAKGYIKQQTAIERTEKQLQSLKDRYKALEDATKAKGGADALETDRMMFLANQIKNVTERLEKQKARLESLRVSLEAAGVDTNNITEEIARLQREIDETNNSTRTFGDTLADSFTNASAALTEAGIADALKEIASAYVECVKLAGEFQYAMSNVEALSGANSSEMVALTNRAKEVAMATKYTATEVADAMGYMGMAGWTAAETLEGIGGVINLAAAAGEDLSITSDIVTDNLTAFGMTAAETGRLVDVMAATATNSNTDVAKMGETFKNSAAIAGALGYSVEDVAVAMGIMANSGVKASIAGTALRNIFNGLVDGVTLTSSAFGEYEVQTINADGTMKGFRETMDELRVQFDKMTEAEKVENARLIAGKRSYNGLLAILNATSESYDELEMQINNCSGAAQRMADIKLDNLNGQLKIMQSAWENLKITLGDEFNGELTDLAGIGKDLLFEINEFVTANPDLIKGLIVGAGSFTALGSSVVGASAAIKAFKMLMVALPSIAPLLGAVGALSAIAGGAVMLHGAVSGVHKDFNDLTATSKAQKVEIDSLEKSLANARATYGENSSEVKSLTGQLAAAQAVYDETRQSAEDFTNEIDSLINAHNELRASVDTTNEKFDIEESTSLGLLERMRQLASQSDLTASEQEELSVIIDMLNERNEGLALTYDDVTGSAKLTTEAIEEEILAEQKKLKFEANREALGRYLAEEAALREASTAAAAEEAAALEELNRVKAEANSRVGRRNVFDALVDTHDINSAADAYEKARQKSADATAAYEDNQKALAELRAEVGEYYEDEDVNKSPIVGYVETVKASLGALGEAYGEVYLDAYESITGTYKLWDEKAKVESLSADNLLKNIKGQREYWDAYREDLELLSKQTIPGLSDVLESFADGSADSVNVVAGLADAAEKSPEKLEKIVAEYQALKQSQGDTTKALTDSVTDIESKVEEMTQTIQDSVASMKMSDEAAQAGIDNIRSYISAADTMMDEVRSAYSRVGNAAMNAMRSRMTPVSPTGYASGTNSATPGIHLVGENGPELLMFNGGEKVLNAAQTARIAEGAKYSSVVGSNNVSVQFNITGNADRGTVDALNSYGDDFAERVLSVIADSNADSARRRYA